MKAAPKPTPLDDLTQRIADLRADREALLTDRRRVQDAPPPRDAIRARVADAVTQLGTRWRPNAQAFTSLHRSAGAQTTYPPVTEASECHRIAARQAPLPAADGASRCCRGSGAKQRGASKAVHGQ
jgi:hypothetical protein